MLVGARQKLSAISANTLQLDGITVALTESVKSFGILLDSTLFMENFITQTSKSCYYQLRGMCWVRKYLNSTETGYHCETGHLAHSVTPRLLQLSPFWSACFLYPKPSSHWELCCSPHPEKCKTAHITPLFQSLHWLPIPQRIQYKINTLFYECITHTAPFYLSNCLLLYTPSSTPHSATLSLQNPRTRLSTVGSRVLSVCFSTWSDPPLPLRKKPSLDSFRSNLKTFLFLKQ